MSQHVTNCRFVRFCTFGWVSGGAVLHFWFALVTQVIPALKRVRASAEASDKHEEENNVAEEVCELSALLGEHESPESLPKQASKVVKDSKVASYQLLRAYDHVLQLLGVGGLKAFEALPQTSRILRPGEVRYQVAVEPWGDYEVEGGGWFRVAIKNMNTGKKRWEVPVVFPDGKPPFLVVAGDECSANLAPMQFLVGELELRFLLMRDLPHRSWNDVRLAIQEVGLWGKVLELNHCLAVKHGPFASQSWWRQMQESMSLHMARHSSACPLLQALLPGLSMDLRPQLTSEPDTAEEQAEIWKKLGESKALHVKSNKATLSRWFEFLERYEQFEKEYTVHQYHFNLTCHYTGAFKHVKDMPVWNEPLAQVKLPARAPKAEAKARGKVGMSAQEAKERLDQQRAKCINAMHLCAVIVGQPLQQRLGRVIVAMTKPIKQAFSKELVGLATREGIWNYYTSFAKHGYSYVVLKTFFVLYQAKTLQYMGFQMHCDDAERVRIAFGLGVAASSSDASQPIFPKVADLKGELADDYHVAETAWKLGIALVGHRATSIGIYQHMLLGCAILLCSPSRSVVRAALARLECMWELVAKAEAHLVAHPELQEVFLSIPFLYNPVLREVLVLLAQHSFKCVPPAVETLVFTIFKGFASSVIVERAFQRCVDYGRNSNNKCMHRPARYFVPHERALLKEHDRAEVEVDCTELTQAGRVVPKAAYDALGIAPSIDDKELQNIINNKSKEYPRRNAQGLQTQVAAWELLRHVSSENQWGKVVSAWQALLVPQGCVLQERSTSAHSLVLRACSWGCLLWLAEKISVNNMTFWKPLLRDGTVASWRPILDVGEWRALLVHPLTPGVCRALGPGAGTMQEGGILVVQTSPPTTLYVAAAKHAFISLTDAHLNKLIAKEGLLEGIAAADRPRGVVRKVDMLVRHFLPGLSDQEVCDILMLRAGISKEQHDESILLVGDNLDHSEGFVENKDLREARDFKKDTHAPKVGQKATMLQYLKDRKMISEDDFAFYLGGATGPKPPNPKASTESDGPKLAVKSAWSWSEVELKRHIPKAKGCTIQEVVRVDGTNSWSGRYPGAKPHVSRSRNYHDAKSSQAAAKHVFTWLWKQHETITGEPMPYDIADASAES